jgi:hypothetical protein
VLWRAGEIWKINRTERVALRARRTGDVGELLLIDGNERYRDHARTTVVRVDGVPPSPECVLEVCRAWRARSTSFLKRNRTPAFLVVGNGAIQAVAPGRPRTLRYPIEPLVLDAEATPAQWKQASLALLDAALTDLEL